ncbi:MAG: hypothetical protein RSF40_02055 [Oscillospiraceae bacterium]
MKQIRMNCIADGKLTNDSCFGCDIKIGNCEIHKLLQEKVEREH